MLNQELSIGVRKCKYLENFQFFFFLFQRFHHRHLSSSFLTILFIENVRSRGKKRYVKGNCKIFLYEWSSNILLNILTYLVPHLGFIIPTRSRRTINRFLAHNVLLPVNRTRWIYNPLAFYLPNVRSEPEHRLNREIKPCNNSKTFISL